MRLSHLFARSPIPRSAAGALVMPQRSEAAIRERTPARSLAMPSMSPVHRASAAGEIDTGADSVFDLAARVRASGEW